MTDQDLKKKAAEAFAHIRGQTLCPFAKKEEVDVASPWDEALSDGENIARFYAELAAYMSAGKTGGMVLASYAPGHSKDIAGTSRFLRALLYGLAQYDASAAECLARDVSSPRWFFRFQEQEIFVAVFSQLYGSQSSRQSYGKEGMYVFFQPGASFLGHKLPDVPNPKEYRKGIIRAAFDGAGQGYYMGPLKVLQHDDTSHGFRFIKPLDPDSPPVRWWVAELDVV